MKKQTAVEWLVSILNKEGFYPVLTDEEINQAKQMECEQIIDAHLKGQREDIDFINEAKEEAKQYYNETYGKQGTE
jgi:arginine decarboxylase-like protein